MKIALVHDYIKEYGGAERVLESLHNMYPDAPVYTLVYAPQFLGPHRNRFASWDIHPSFLQFMPFSYKFISLYRLIAPFVFKAFDFSQFDIIIVSATGAYSPNIINKKNARQICYCHTPPRYLYGYATAREWKKHFIFRVLGELANHVLRMVDYISSKNVDLYIANSRNVAARIEKFYRRDSVVVYPPSLPSVKSRLSNPESKTSYFLAGGRLTRAKHFDLIIKACNQLKLPLKVFGKSFAGYGDELRLLSGKNIEFVGEVSDEEKLTLMQNARAFIFAGEDEDFGIVPVESMAMGTPVIAYKSGGLIETVIDGKTGLFFDSLTVESLTTALKEFNHMKWSSKVCIAQAQNFSEEKFQKGIKKYVNQFLKSS